jgi:hypothetical protein
MILKPHLSTKFDRYLWYLIFSLFAGVLAGGLQKDVLIKHEYWNEVHGGFWETSYFKLHVDFYNGTRVGEYHSFIERGWRIGDHLYIGYDNATFTNNPNATYFIDDLSYYTWTRRDEIIGWIVIGDG